MKLGKPTFIVSARADDLVEALKKSSQIITVWIRSGKFKNKYPLLRNTVIYEAKSKADAKDYAKRFIAVFSIPKTHTKLSVLKGISGSQIFQLLSYTRSDRLIRTQTHDFDFFRTKKSFLSWKVRGKVIYILINRTGKLLGIIWFNKKRPESSKEKPAIRIYLPARGKKVARTFLNIVKLNYKSATATSK